MVRYAGDGPRGGGIPIQREASAYFGRMATAPSKAFRVAVNQAIYEWKQQGNWANLKGLWLLCADTAQAAALSVIGDTPRDMTVTGAPTFTALKGYSGLDGTTKQLVFPITSTILADDSFTALIACNVDLAHAADEMVIENATSAAITSQGNFKVTALGVFQCGATGASPAPANNPGLLAALSIVGGSRGAVSISGSGQGFFSGSGSGRGSTYKTGNVAAPHPCTRLAALGYLGSASSARQAQSFVITLTKLIDTLGALD